MLASLAIAVSGMFAGADPSVKGIEVGPPLLGQTFDQMEQQLGFPFSLSTTGIGSSHVTQYFRKTGPVETMIIVTFTDNRVSTVEYRHFVKFAGRKIRF